MPPYDDEKLRSAEFTTEPNYRMWRLAFEADCENWFHT